MKIYIKRSAGGAIKCNPLAPNFSLTPLSVLRAIGHRPLSGPPVLPIMANYIGLGANGGNNFASPQPGIKLARNGTWIPLKVNYFRTTVANRITFTDDLNGIATGIDSSYRDVSFVTANGISNGDANIKGELSPVGPPVNLNFVTQRDVMFPSKLNVSPGASSNVDYEKSETFSSGPWSQIKTTNGFPGASNYLANTFSLENTYLADGLWQRQKFLTDPRVATCSVPDRCVQIQSAICEYYELEIDDTLVSNIASLVNDVFIVMPFSYSNNASAPFDNYAVDGVRSTANVITESFFELVLPLSYVIAQLNIAPNISNSLTGVVGTGPLGNVITDAAGGYNLDFAIQNTVSFTPQTEISLIDPLPGSAIGPF